MPPAVTGEGGNTGTGCVGIFVAQDGYVRMIFRGQQFSLVGGDHHDVQWPIGHQVGLMLAGVSHRVQWLPSVADSVRVWAEAGTYLWGQCVHVMAHDSTVPLGSLFALRA